MEEKLMKDQGATHTIDQVLNKLGGFWFFQWMMIASVAVLSIPYNASIFLMIFHAYNPPWVCAPKSTLCFMNGTMESTNTRRCHLPRSDWDYTLSQDNSMIVEFDLICDRAYLKQLLSSTVFLGSGVGAIVLGYAGDNYGRKRVMYPSITMIMIISCILSFLKSVPLIIFCRFIIGVFLPGLSVQKFVLVSEYVDTDHRPLSTLFMFSFNIFVTCVLLLKAYFIKQWRILQLVCAAPYLVALLSVFFIPESIRWMRLKGKKKELEKTLRRIAFWNGKDFPSELMLAPLKENIECQKSSLVDLFKTRRLAIITCILSYTWLVNGMVFYALFFAAGNLGGSIYMSLLLMNAVGLVGEGFNAYLCKRFGRKKSTMIGMFFASVFCLLIAFAVGKNGSSRVGCGVAGVLFIGMSFSAIHTWSVEIYATTMRTNGMGFLQVASRVGAASSPWVANALLAVHPSAPYVVLGAVSLVGAFMLTWIPETSDKTMLDVPENVTKCINTEDVEVAAET